MAEIDKAKPNQFEEQGMNPFNAPTPGESLTRDPEQKKFPWERPPEITDVDTAIKEVFVMLTERKSLINLLGLLKDGQPVDEIAQMVAYRGMSVGKYNSDLMLLLLEPLMYLIIAIAEEYEIDPVIYEGMDEDIFDENDIPNTNNTPLPKPKVNNDSVPSSLLSRVKDLPSQEELEQENNMAFDWLSLGAGIAEADMAGKQQEFEQALVNFREDKKLVNTLASNNYARKLDNYDKEVLKLEKIEQAYSTAAKLDKTNAAHVIAQAEQPELYKILTDRDDGSVDTLAQSYASNFTDITNDKGEVTGFKINRKDFILNEPVASDFFKGKDFWDKEVKNIASNTTSFLGGQLRELLGKDPKKVDVTNYLEKLNKETDYQVKSFVGEDGKALPDKEYISTVVGDASPLSAFNFLQLLKRKS